MKLNYFIFFSTRLRGTRILILKKNVKQSNYEKEVHTMHRSSNPLNARGKLQGNLANSIVKHMNDMPSLS
jgi:hypothetical protein